MRRWNAGRTPLAIATAGALLAVAGCGARWDDDQHAAVLARAEGQAAASSPAAGGGRSGAGSTSGATTDASATGDTTGATTVGGGPAPAAGGPTDAGGDVAAESTSAALPCTAPSDAPGVTDDTITVGTISTVTGPVPGLGASALGGVQSYVAYRNSLGGVCGRQIDLKVADDGADNGRHRATVNDMSSQVLGLVGGLGGGDAGSADTVEQLNMPVVATAISEQFQDAATVFDINPPFADVHALIGKYRYLYDQGVRKAAVVYLDVEQSRAEAHGKQRPQMEAAGIQIVSEQALPLSTLSYDSAARAVANSGADYLFFLADSGASASMAQSMADTGYDGLRFAEYLTAYGSNFIDLAGPAAEGTTSWIRTLPNEEPDANQEMAAFLEWMAQIAPDTVADTFAADSWAAAKAFFDGLEALPGPISRDALLAQLRSVTTYDAGGMLGPIQLGPKLSNGCAIAMIVESGAWRRLAPDQGFLC